jgi:hypothetical protein
VYRFYEEFFDQRYQGVLACHYIGSVRRDRYGRHRLIGTGDRD